MISKRNLHDASGGHPREEINIRAGRGVRSGILESDKMPTEYAQSILSVLDV